MRVFGVCTLLFLCSPPSWVWAGSGICPSGAIYNGQTDKCYNYVITPTEFTIAEQNCAGLGGHLTSIRNAFENSILQQNAVELFNGSADYWTGGNDLTTAGAWTWVDGTPFLFTNWDTGYPQQFGNGLDCISAYMQSNGKWRNVDCFEKKSYVCEVPQLVLTTCPPTPSCPTQTCPNYPPCTPTVCPASCPSEWAYFVQTDSCYKVFYNQKWEDAEEMCQQFGAHLASLHSEAENTFVANLAHSGEKLDPDGMTWVGMHTTTNGATWEWTDGTPLDYFHWASGQPDNPGSENCVQLFSDRSRRDSESNWYEEWNNIACTENMRTYVCKKPAAH